MLYLLRRRYLLMTFIFLVLCSPTIFPTSGYTQFATISDVDDVFNDDIVIEDDTLWINFRDTQDMLHQYYIQDGTYVLNDTFVITADGTSAFFSDTMADITIYDMQWYNTSLQLLVYDKTGDDYEWKIVSVDPTTYIVTKDRLLTDMLPMFYFDMVYVDDKLYIGGGSSGITSQVDIYNTSTLELIEEDVGDFTTDAGFAYDGEGIWTHERASDTRRGGYKAGSLVRYNLEGEMDMVIEEDTNVFNPDGGGGAEDIMYYDGSIVGLYDQGRLIQFAADQAVTTGDVSLSINTVLVGITITLVVYSTKSRSQLQR